MDPLIGASFTASFFAGVAALFAPCCITVLLPAYFASIFKQKIKIFFMTFVFFLGLLTVFLPIGMGASFISQLVSQYHNFIFILGAVFLIFLGILLLTRRAFSLPIMVHPKLENYDVASIFVLGIFSGLATLCCAPVLAGVVALSILPGSVIFGAVYTLAYVLGMVLPLFIIAYFLDKTNIMEKISIFKKGIKYRAFGQNFSTSLSNIFSGAMFLILGFVILYLARTNQLTQHSSYQITINATLANFTKSVSVWTGLIPGYIWIGVFAFVFLIIIKLARDEFVNKKKGGGK
ncbi:MAG: hypothetical protein A3C30_01740 [Candidatus Levybacteria bacterium RIFCSPHIGHO2_02_FULL_40_18]|nr:MAG: hypothetical protein A2869_00730 [Candidatus Levybacteria bacterium RIFCSPHIGHO2_01_FULL_40_58]OGH26714.1 MAG: hypothetical protein A3C30_01740 [Candidatus Levybacteria bacterium RIFCSPHIGHO2_02_FULL_40_18]OGH31649.1 MAG: hypothetical protein A3E43_01460 [Candidatus Levybacteria bacterium RIFCSPHIGHO2_12_FULL_40_31]OGH40549.1 MAG: hypothetical protein A2894_00010 [Candidatus Levybacteria bacterium RIFCSPLOWO2_01_FULL_40_64]OGH48725.1 MAG: hypothetical protein A3I54_03635 [Candidatus Lev